MDEKKLLEKIRNSAEQIEAPDSLQPDQIEEMLKEKAQKKKKLPVYRFGMAAAVLLLAFVAVKQVRIISSRTEKYPVSEETTTEKQTGKKETTGKEQKKKQAETSIQPVSSEDELYQTLSKIEQTTVTNQAKGAMVLEDSGVAEDSMSSYESEESAAAATGEMDYSQTNLQEIGVDEADIVKTDGSYLYAAAGNQVKIIKADQGELSQTAQICFSDASEQIRELYLDGDYMNIITVYENASMEEDEEDLYYIHQETYSNLYTYDISDRTKPVEQGKVSQEGRYRTSRKNGDTIYLFSSYSPVISKTKDSSKILPLIDGTKMSVEDIYLPEEQNAMDYLVVTSMNVKNPKVIKDRKAIVSGAYLFYVSTENIYICNNMYDRGSDTTQIMKFHYTDGEITPAAIKTVPGYVNDSFSMNEYQGYLRMVVTEWDGQTEKNHLYVLDENLNMSGSIVNLAPGETIRSARFFGETGYFVTFRQMDPLFSVDFNDPQNPKILGELKISGFSSYLHFYGENRLLGLGEEVDPDTGEYKGIKLSMFDLSDPADVKEIDKYVIKDQYDCPGLYNYKAILADPEKNILGFECDNHYMIFTWQEGKGFVNQFLYEPKDEQGNKDWLYQMRGLYIGSTFYLSHDGGVKAFAMEENYQEIGEISYSEE